MNQSTAPRSMSAVIGTGTGIFTGHFPLLYGLALTSSIPAAFAPEWLLDIPKATDSFDQIWNALFPNAFLVGFAIFLLGAIAGGASARAIGGIVAGRPVGLGEAYGDALAQLLPLAWTAILGGILIGIGMLLLIVPGIYLALCFVFISPIVMLEAKSGPAALGRSRELAKGNLLRILGLCVIAGVIGIVISVLPPLVPEAQKVARAALTAGLNGLLGAWLSAVFVALYFDIRRSREGGGDPGEFSPPAIS